jgi:uncharacterized protein (DUF2141 family)
VFCWEFNNSPLRAAREILKPKKKWRCIMIRRAMLICILLSFGASLSYGQDKFSVSGELSFLKEGDIYIGLYTQEEWQDRRVKPPNFVLHLKPKEAHKQGSKLPFKFDGVPGGTYGVYAFQDENGNGKQDWRRGSFSLEPWGTYRHTTTAEWHEVNFDVKADIDGILFVLMKPEGTGD